MHGVVKLILARMKSHPDEFVSHRATLQEYGGRAAGRWQDVMYAINEYGNEEEQNAIAGALREIQLDVAHERAMDELLNGDERRAETKRREHEAMQQMYKAQSQLASNQYNLMQSTLPTGLANASSSYAPYLQLGPDKDATLTADILKKLKKAAGL